MRWMVTVICVMAVAGVAGLCLCSSSSGGTERFINGAGATFPEPLYYRMFDMYHRQHGTKVNYRGEGSGAGMRELLAKRVDFAGTDIGGKEPGQHEEGAAQPLVRVPTCLGAVAVIYNLPDNPKLRFTSDILGDIFLGRISKWNDPRLVAVNSGVKLPDLAINVTYRSDESGTTYIFTDYLSKTTAQWRKAMGAGTPYMDRPMGLGAKGNPALTGMVRQITGAIGYVELTYAVANGMTFGSVKNRAGKFIDPSPVTVASAANAGGPSENGISLTDTSMPDGYPIIGFTWLVVFKEQNYGGRSKETAEDLVKMLHWVTHEGQKYASPLRYVPLPRILVKKTEAILRTITYDGVPLFGKRP
jgi:phosphate transport system substrate-binding protein